MLFFFFRIYFLFYCLFVLIFWSRLCRCVLVPGRLAFRLLYPQICDYFLLLVFLGLALCDHRISTRCLSGISNQDGHWVCWWSWVERTFMWRQRKQETLRNTDEIIKKKKLLITNKKKKSTSHGRTERIRTKTQALLRETAEGPVNYIRYTTRYDFIYV